MWRGVEIKWKPNRTPVNTSARVLNTCRSSMNTSARVLSTCRSGMNTSAMSSEHTPHCTAGVFPPPIMGGKWKFEVFCPPIFRDSGGEIWFFAPPYFETLGGKSIYFPRIMGGKSPPQAENFEDLEIWNAKFPLQKCISASQILKIFRLRRAIFMLGFLYKMYCSDWNPKKFRVRRATLCVFIIGLSRIQRANRFVNSRSAFCAS